MYNLKSLITKVVTIKFNNGMEIIAKFLGMNDEGTILTLGNPKVIVISEKDLAIIPYMYTGDTKEVYVRLDSVQTIVKSVDKSAADYEDLVKNK